MLKKSLNSVFVVLMFMRSRSFVNSCNIKTWSRLSYSFVKKACVTQVRLRYRKSNGHASWSVLFACTGNNLTSAFFAARIPNSHHKTCLCWEVKLKVFYWLCGQQINPRATPNLYSEHWLFHTCIIILCHTIILILHSFRSRKVKKKWHKEVYSWMSALILKSNTDSVSFLLFFPEC